MSSTATPFSDTEKNVLLAEILKSSGINPLELAQLLRRYSIQPRWENIKRPEGRSMEECRFVFGEMMGRLPGWSPPAPGMFPTAPAGLPTAGGYVNIQPRPENVPPAWQPHAHYPMHSLDPPKRKRGRPSKAERERERAEYFAKGLPWPPPSRRRKPPAESKQTAAGEKQTAAATEEVRSATPPQQTGTESVAGDTGSARKRQRMSLSSSPQATPLQQHYQHQPGGAFPPQGQYPLMEMAPWNTPPVAAQHIQQQQQQHPQQQQQHPATLPPMPSAHPRTHPHPHQHQHHHQPQHHHQAHSHMPPPRTPGEPMEH